MDQQEESPSPLAKQSYSLLQWISFVFFCAGFVTFTGFVFITLRSKSGLLPDVDNWFGLGGATLALLGVVIYNFSSRDRAIANENQARERVRKAEDNLGNALRTNSAQPNRYWRGAYLKSDGTRVRGHWVSSIELQNIPPVQINEDAEQPELEDEQKSIDETRDGTREEDYPQVFKPEPKSLGGGEERLTLAALWEVTHSRLDLYHEIVTGQARRSFRSAQAAMWIGFLLLIGFAVLAAEAKTTTGAISIGSLGAVGAAFAAFIGRTFVRSQESAASHLRAYFDQPLELSRYLAAERLLADDARLTDDQHSETFSTLVQSIAMAGRSSDGNGNAENEPHRSKTRRRNEKN